MNIEQMEREIAAEKARTHNATLAANHAEVARRAGEVIDQRRSGKRAKLDAWIAALEALKASSLARMAVIAAEIDAPPPDVVGDDEDGTRRYNAASAHRHRRAQFREELAILRERLAAIEKGGIGETDIPDLLGIRPQPLVAAAYPGLVSLPQARKMLAALSE